ncbi:MAG: hypothetical protein ACI8P9_004105 [Parasphingorhabdus sp.]|jgi:hypothetical protein
MYTDEDLNKAVSKGIFSEEAVGNFRQHIAELTSSEAADEENFRLIASFNDIFVVIACMLLLFSVGWVTFSIHAAVATASVAILSWFLAEFFVLKRKMALPGIVLLNSYVIGVFTFVLALSGFGEEVNWMIAGAVSTAAAWFHWKRFKVPITVAAGVATAVVCVLALLVAIIPALEDNLNLPMFICGLVTFYIAMHWDSSDLSRTSGKSDVAFWLHLISAPLIVHPVFSYLGVLEGTENLANLIAVIALYIVLIILSVVIDRRAFMVSSLVYVLYALTELFSLYGLEGDSFAYVGVIIGFSLLLLSGFWRKTRAMLFEMLPTSIQNQVPGVS